MRLFHFSDTHLGHQQYPRTGPDGLNQRESDLYAAFRRVVDLAVAERPDLVVHAGDLFDGVRPGNRALAHAMEGLLELSRAGIPVVLIAGNHEHPRMRETGSPFRLFAHLPGVHPVHRGRRETIEVRARDGTLARIHAVPQCADADALAAEIDAAPVRGTAQGAPTEGLDVLVVHGAVHSLQAFHHAEFNELTLDPRQFARFDYVALGHHHGCQQVAPNAWYCGAPERVSMAEAGEPKGFLDVEVAAGHARATFRGLPGRPYADLPPIHGDGLGSAALEIAAAQALARVPAGAVCRLRLLDLDPALRGVLDPRRLRQGRPDLLHLDLRLEWADAVQHVQGSPRLGGLAEEFEAFAARQVVEGVDRTRLLALARNVLGEEGAPHAVADADSDDGAQPADDADAHDGHDAHDAHGAHDAPVEVARTLQASLPRAVAP